MFADSELKLIEQLVGPLTEATAKVMYQNIDCFLYPRVSLFIPASGQCRYAITPNHTHPSYAFLYYFQPLQELILEGKSLSYDNPDGKLLVAISPDIPHQEVEQETFQSYIAIMIEKAFFEEAWKTYALPLPVFRGEPFAPHPELLALLRCFMLSAERGKVRDGVLLEHLSHVVLHFILQSILKDNHKELPLYDRFEIDRAIAYMNSHFSEKIAIEDISASVNLSAGHFSKVFRAVTGSTPVDYLKEIRLQKSRSLLQQGFKNMTEIALECGFGTSSYFSTCFVEKYHMTPTSYRQKLMNQ